MSECTNTILKGSKVIYRPRRPALPDADPDGAHGKATSEAAAETTPESLEISDCTVAEEAESHELEEQLEAARQSGWLEGYERGRKKIEPFVQMLETLTKSISEERGQLIREAELVVVRLACEIAKRILHREVQLASDVVVYEVREALRRIADRDHIIVRVNPEDVEVLRRNSERDSDLFADFGKVEIREDENISRGGCLVETSTGLIDATVETQLAEVEAALFGEE